MIEEKEGGDITRDGKGEKTRWRKREGEHWRGEEKGRSEWPRPGAG